MNGGWQLSSSKHPALSVSDSIVMWPAASSFSCLDSPHHVYLYLEPFQHKLLFSGHFITQKCHLFVQLQGWGPLLHQWELPITGKTLRLVSMESWEESVVFKVPGRYLQKTIFIFSYVNIHGAIIFLWWYPAGSYCVLAHKVLLLLEIPRNWRGNLTK